MVNNYIQNPPLDITDTVGLLSEMGDNSDGSKSPLKQPRPFYRTRNGDLLSTHLSDTIDLGAIPEMYVILLACTGPSVVVTIEHPQGEKLIIEGDAVGTDATHYGPTRRFTIPGSWSSRQLFISGTGGTGWAVHYTVIGVSGIYFPVGAI